MANIVLASKRYEELQAEMLQLGAIAKYKTGFAQFDEAKRFLRPGQLITIAAGSGEGKTSFARTLTHRFTENGYKVCWFSMEESYDEFFEKSPSLNFHVPHTKESNKMEWVIEHSKKAIAEHGTQIIFIDNLSHLREPKITKQVNSMGIAQYVGAIVQELHDFAIDANVVIFLLHHVDKVAGKEHKAYSQYDLRDSSEIANLSNSVIFIQRDVDKASGVEQKTSKIYADKWRAGGTKPRIDVFYDEEAQLFRELTAEDIITIGHQEQQKQRKLPII